MSTVTTSPAYPFDPTGSKASNKVLNEQHILSPGNPRDAYFIVPYFAPFFEDGLVLTFKDTNGVPKTLVKNVDYYLTHMFLEASYSTAKPIYGSITFLNTALAGIVKLDQYRTVGGEWVRNENDRAAILADRLHNPRTTSWEQVANLPVAFPPIAHEYELKDMKGLDDLVGVMERIVTAILSRSGVDLTAHVTNMNNPHGLTAAKLNAYTKTEADARINQLISTALANHVKTHH